VGGADRVANYGRHPRQRPAKYYLCRPYPAVFIRGYTIKAGRTGRIIPHWTRTKNTFGKGSVQVILPIDDTEALRLTIARYYLPSGRTIQAVGVTPDVVVHPGKVPQSDDSAFSIKESELKAHLKSELNKINPTSEGNKTEAKDDKKIITQKKVDEDIQLKTAIDTIKILKIKQ